MLNNNICQCRKLLLDEGEVPVLRLPSMSGRDTFSRRCVCIGFVADLQMHLACAVSKLLTCSENRTCTHFPLLLQPCSAEADEVLGSAGAEAAAVGLLEPAVLPFQR